MKRVCALILTLTMVFNLTLVAYGSGEAGMIQSSAYGNTYVIRDDGSLWGWGGSYVGNNTGYKEKQLTPVKILENVRSVSAGTNSTYVAVKKDDTLWAWGDCDGYPSGPDEVNPRFLVPTKLAIDDVKSAAAGNDFILALKTDNSLWLCGDMVIGDGTLTKAEGREGFVKIAEDILTYAAGNDNVFYVKDDQTLWGYGHNGHAQMGNMTDEGDDLSGTETLHTPVMILEDVKYVYPDTNGNVIFAIRLDNSLYAWGDDGFYTQDQGWVEDAGKPYKVMDDVKSAAVDSTSAFIIKNDKSLWAWGYDYRDGNNSNEKSLYKMMDGVNSITLGERHASVVKTDNTLWTMGGNYRGGLGHEGDETWYTPMTKILSNIQDAPDAWAMDEVEKAIGAQLIPEDMQSNYTKSITREEFCILAIRMIEVRSEMTIDEYLAAAKLEIAPKDSFIDCDTKEVLAAKALGITDGTSPTTFEPDKLLTREQAAKFLSTTAIACGRDVSLKSPAYADLSDIAGWAQPYTGYVYDIGVMKGTGGNMFSPKNSYQRQQAFMTMYRIWLAIDTVYPEKVGASNDASVSTIAYDKMEKYTDLTTIKAILEHKFIDQAKNAKFTYTEIGPERSEEVAVLYKEAHVREERPQGLNGDTTSIYNSVVHGTYGIVKPGNYTDYKAGNDLYMYRLTPPMLARLEGDTRLESLEIWLHLGVCHILMDQGNGVSEKYTYSLETGLPTSYLKLVYNDRGGLESQVDWEGLEIDTSHISEDDLFVIPQGAQ